jgi:hypothetical protein
VNIDDQGRATLEILIGGLQDVAQTKFSVDIDWSDGTDFSPFATASGIVNSVSHTYLGNPGEETTDPIPYTVTVEADDRIDFSAGDVDLTTTVVTGELQVPRGGLPFAAAPQSSQIVTFVAIRQQRLTEATITQTSLPQFFDQADISNSAADSSAAGTRRYVLRVVTPVDEAGNVSESEDIELQPDVLSNLAKLFRRLEDDRYRIYLILEDDSEQLVKDIQVRDHRASEVGEGDVAVESPSAQRAPVVASEVIESDSEPDSPVPQDEQQVPQDPPDEASLSLPDPSEILRRNTAIAIGVTTVLAGTESGRQLAAQHRDEREQGEQRSLGRAVRRWRRGAQTVE